LDIDTVQKYLAENLDSQIKVLSCRQTFPGMSRETWLIEAEIGQKATPRGLVLRVDPPSGGGVPVPLKVEWEVYQRLYSSPVPVAKPLWFNEDIEFAEGRSHMVRDMVEGTTEVEGLHEPGPAGNALREKICKTHAEALALVHTLDWNQYGFAEVFPVPASPADAMRSEFEIWKGKWIALRTDPFPVITEALFWLQDLMPETSGQISLIKGNNGVGEEIWKDNRIVAMSDWELATLGEPCLDWAFSQGMLGLWNREQVLQHYEQAAGFSLSREMLAFCHIWITFKAVVCLNSTMNAFLTGIDRRPVIAGMGLGTAKNMERILSAVINCKDVFEAEQIATRLRTSPYHSKQDSK
jgi:aminoglycoside phosphotransferase (APT) family kinase protein|tara:strand:+ start:1161 stop:2219 length:1059 start_codon:yes stop_codon:yes gene_type:complete